MSALLKPLWRRQVVGVPAPSPHNLFSAGEQGTWYDPSDLSTLFQDSAGTTPITADGQPVGLALDKSGNGNHASQATATARPLYRTDGTRHWLEFDGVDDFLSTAAFAWGSDAALHSFALTRTAPATAIICEFSPRVATNAGSFNAVTGDAGVAEGYSSRSWGSVSADSAGQTSSLNAATPPSTNVFTTSHSISGDMTQVRVDGVNGPIASADKGLGDFGTYALYLAARAGTSAYLNGRIYGAILRNVLPTAGQLSMIESYLASKSGVVLS